MNRVSTSLVGVFFLVTVMLGGHAAAQVTPAAVRDQGRVFETDGVVSLGTDTWSQSITTGIAGKLQGIQFQIHDTLPPPVPPTIDFDFWIFDGGNPPTGSALFSAQVSLSGEDVIYTWDVSSANLFFDVGDTFTFALSVQQTGVDIAADYQDDGNGYAGGELFKNGTALPLETSDMAFITYVVPEPETLPFARLELRTTFLKFVHPGWDGFQFSAEYDLNENSDGIDPKTEDVTVSFGTYTETLPAGAFVCTGSDCVYDNGGSGITHAAINEGLVEVEARHVDLAETVNPVEVLVQIGNDSGNAVESLSGKLMLCGLGFELAFLLPPLMWLHKRRRGRNAGIDRAEHENGAARRRRRTMERTSLRSGSQGAGRCMKMKRRASLAVLALGFSLFNPNTTLADAVPDLAGGWDWVNTTESGEELRGLAAIWMPASTPNFGWGWVDPFGTGWGSGYALNPGGPDEHPTISGSVVDIPARTNDETMFGSWVGQVSVEGNSIAGSWTQSDGQSGAFVATRLAGVIEILSDATWKFSRQEELDWQQPGFDDSSWGNTVGDSAGRCGTRVGHMWAPDARAFETIFVRKTIDLPALPSRATLAAAFDDDGSVYVNGILVDTDDNGFSSGMRAVDIADELQIGRNVIAIEASDDYGGCQAILVVAVIEPLEDRGFDRFELQEAFLRFVHPGWDGFHFSAEYDLNENSDGIDPETEDVTISFGTYTETLPAGAFVCTGSDCVYHNGGSGITDAAISEGFLEFSAGHVDLAGMGNRIEIAVKIGNDSGNAVESLSGRLILCGIGFELAFLVPPLMWLRERRRRRMQ